MQYHAVKLATKQGVVQICFYHYEPFAWCQRFQQGVTGLTITQILWLRASGLSSVCAEIHQQQPLLFLAWLVGRKFYLLVHDQ